MANCFPTFLDTPSFYSTTLHFLSFIAIPTHLFGAYCILFKTPQRMISVKWSLLHLHFWTCFVDLGLNTLTIPYILLPVYAGAPLGILRLTGMSTEVQVILMMTSLAVMCFSIVCIFENRYHVIVLSARSHYRVPWFLINICISIVITVFIPILCFSPEAANLEELLQALPCLPEDVKSENIMIVIEEHPLAFLKLAAAQILFLVSQILLFFQLIKRYFRQFNTKLSERTICLQKKLISQLILQLIIPFFILLSPVAYCGLSVWTGYHNQALNNLSFIVISSHGMFSTMAMVLIHVPYREEVMRLIRGAAVRPWNQGERSHVAAS